MIYTDIQLMILANIFLRLAMKQISVAFRKRGWCSAFLMTRNLQGQNSENKQSLKKELVNGTNERLTFLEIYELSMHKCRIIAFQIPPAIRGIPTTWQGAAYAREHESLCPLPMK